MPCRCDYMEASAREVESRNVCNLIKNLLKAKGEPVPDGISRGATNYYGDVSSLDANTAWLCEQCRKFTVDEQNKYLYDGRDANARKLADWWECHQEADAKIVAQEKAKKDHDKLRKQALAKLTVAEKKALGLQ